MGRKFSHIYTLNISTSKNQSTNVHGALYIPTNEYNYKFIIGCDTILQEYYITDMAQMRKHKEIYNNERYKRRSRVIKEKLESQAGASKERTLDGLPMIHASAVHL